MSSIPTLLLIVLAAAMVLMIILWTIQLRTKNAGVVDAGWAGGLGAAAVFVALAGDGDPYRRIIVGAIGGIWGFRLCFHLLRDRIIGEPEEGRYQKLRSDWGEKANRNLFLFFEAQAILVAILAVPFAFAATSNAEFPAIWDIIAPVVWIVGIVGESVADMQLYRFKRRSGTKGQVCKDGLWRYSRHPNYFFEWLMWLAYGLLALSAPLGWIALFAPALMLFLILKVTGIPPTEQRAVESRGDAYREYQRTTSAFVPLPPKKPHESDEPRKPTQSDQVGDFG